MTFDQFKTYYAEVMAYYQCIEHDIKYIYSFMLSGDVNHNYADIENKTLGNMIRILEDLDYSDNKPYISRDDYSFLKDICDKRNYYAHNVFQDFLYKGNDFIYSKEYKKASDLIIKDHQEVQRASNILEKMRIEFCKDHQR